MIHKFIFLFVTFISVVSFAADESVKIKGFFEQGGIVYGILEPEMQIYLDGNKIPTSKEGIFVIGFEREAPPQSIIEIKKNNKIIEKKTVNIKKRDWQIQRIDGLAQKHVSPDLKTVERIKQENALISSKREVFSKDPWFSNGIETPAKGRISSPFGAQRILNGEPRAPHSGIDIAAPIGTPVYSAADGIVTLVHEDMFLTGKTVMIDHGLALSTIYVHLDKIFVKNKQKVVKGEKIGTVGKTGRATGAHLHFGVTVGKTKIDPEIFLENPLPTFLKSSK